MLMITHLGLLDDNNLTFKLEPYISTFKVFTFNMQIFNQWLFDVSIWLCVNLFIMFG